MFQTVLQKRQKVNKSKILKYNLEIILKIIDTDTAVIFINLN